MHHFNFGHGGHFGFGLLFVGIALIALIAIVIGESRKN